jgi:hypothetical protein
MKQKFLIPISIIIAALIISGTIFYLKKQTKVSGTLPPQEAAKKAIDFINQNKEMFGIGGTEASLVSVVEENGVYKIKLKIGQNEYDSYVTKNGKVFFTYGIDLTQKISSQTEKKEPEKRERPDVKLFVMSYCPYGLQMEKALLPVWQILKDKTDIGIYFVDYIMHEKKEIDENLRQYCIQKEQKEKYLAYLSCFVKDGNFEKCLSEVGVDKDKMNSCISKTDQEFKITQNYNDKSTWLNGYYPRFDVYTDLNEKYGVKGSPTLVINDVVLEVERSPEKVKEAICNAFLNPPSECQQNLSSTSTSPGFGLDSGSSSSGKCE